MYCSTCGVAVAQGLSYCNYCGSKLSGARGDNASQSSDLKPETLIQAMLAAFVCGLGAIIGLIAVMKSVLELNQGQILAFTLLSFLIMIVLEGVFIRLLLRGKRGTEKASDTVLLNEKTTKELAAAHERMLPEPVPSVTEHTTRAFDPIYRERKSE